MAKRTLTSIEIPQADSLENVRRVVEAIASGAATRKEISEKTDISLRHIDYAIHAAKSLGFLAEGEGLSVSDSGRALAATGRGSNEERDALKVAINANEVVSLLAPGLLADAAPAKADLTKHIQEACPELSEATAARRAQTLLAWRSQVLATPLPFDDEAAGGASAPAAGAEIPAPKAPAPKKAPKAKKPVAKLVKKPAAKKAAPKKAAKPAAKKAAPKKAAAKKAAPKKAAATPAPEASGGAPERTIELEPGAE